MDTSLLVEMTRSINNLWRSVGDSSGFIPYKRIFCLPGTTSEYSISGWPLPYGEDDEYRFFLWRRPVVRDSLGDRISVIRRRGENWDDHRRIHIHRRFIRHYRLDDVPETYWEGLVKAFETHSRHVNA